MVVSTNTINLQEQLNVVRRTGVGQALGQPIEACLVKGRNNYCACRLDKTVAC